MKIYLAGPFFNETEVRNIEYAEQILKEKGLEYFSPMRHEERTEEPGTSAWKCGYAFAKGKPVILVHVNADADSNLMMHCGCRANISLQNLKDYDFDTMPGSEYAGAML